MAFSDFLYVTSLFKLVGVTHQLEKVSVPVVIRLRGPGFDSRCLPGENKNLLSNLEKNPVQLGAITGLP